MTRVAAIDCGTNSIRLLIADLVETPNGPSLTDVLRQMRVVRLGQDVDATGEFAPEALTRTFAAIDEYAQLIREHGATSIRFVATSATRDAKNRNEFAAGVRQRLGVDPEVVPGEVEAALSYAGASSVAPAAPGTHILVVDLGGGSTEFVLGNGLGPVASRSMDMGCVRLTERFWRLEKPTPESIAAARAQVNAVLDEVQRDVDFSLVDRIVGVAGTITTLTAAALGLDKYDSTLIHGSEVDIDKLESTVAFMLEAERETRASLGFMHPGRVDVIAAGALIYGCILERVAQASSGRITTATASEHDILDGIALGLGTGH
ncbi:Ppx/GppA phosphatase family protein [Paeniglutamicibacter sulfureus]|uniref:Ppx/GppA phosphatase family protein n=1 Tax=Paeniglutamicibacter sulfureus TaxID=43666 RepID=UPI0026650AD7|nr:Ppx/GppA phosphatase family protein [Paeniglutamicibacter sulfureus]MDO2933256.1 Ppx/GppA phosphatase family protein [Paeniglutamicibacter sulfureus]